MAMDIDFDSTSLMDLLWKADETTRFEERRQTAFSISVDEAQRVRAYLKNPTHIGVWRLRAKWNVDSGVSSAVWQQISEHVAAKDIIEIQTGKQHQQIDFSKLDLKELKKDITKRLSFVLEFFKYLRLLEEPASNKSKVFSGATQVAIEAVDVSRIQADFAEAFDYYKTQIDAPNLTTTIRGHNPSRLRQGFFILMSGPLDTETITCCALSLEPLAALQKFLELTKKITLSELRPIFSPEEEVFEPYFDFVQVLQESIKNDARLNPQFERAFSEYSNKRYESCVSALGVIAEDYLTQVYETLLREVAPRGRTLGQLYDCLHVELNNLFKKEPSKPADFGPIYDSIGKALKEITADNSHKGNRSLEIIRDVLTALRIDRAHTDDILRRMKDHETHISVFPAVIRQNINELIRYRNAAAHKTRVPIGNYEALRMLYTLLTFVMWWQETLNAVDWSLTKDAILQWFMENARP